MLYLQRWSISIFTLRQVHTHHNTSAQSLYTTDRWNNTARLMLSLSLTPCSLPFVPSRASPLRGLHINTTNRSCNLAGLRLLILIHFNPCHTTRLKRSRDLSARRPGKWHTCLSEAALLAVRRPSMGFGPLPRVKKCQVLNIFQATIPPR